MVAKVADFGLSKLTIDANGEAPKSHITTQVKGTLGYLDPEYFHSQQLSDKSDVYSFGVVLLELVSGLPPIVEGSHILAQVKNRLANGGVTAVADPFMGEFNLDGLAEMLDIAFRCCNERSGERPTMAEVEKELGFIASGGMYVIPSEVQEENSVVMETLYLSPIAGKRGVKRGDFAYSGEINFSDVLPQ